MEIKVTTAKNNVYIMDSEKFSCMKLRNAIYRLLSTKADYVIASNGYRVEIAWESDK